MPSPAGAAARPALPRPRSVPGLTTRDLAALLRRAGAAVDVVPADAPATPLSGVTLDSRAVRPGDLYAALPGARAHGADFAADTLAAGAVALLTDPEGAARAATTGLPALVTDDPRAVLGRAAAAVYGDPGDAVQVLGVTGTNGKTTTCYLLEHALRAAGRTTGLVGTVEIRVADERVPSVRTTPESPDVHALLAVMRERGVTTCAMEVSSHALALHRVDGLVVDVAGFTNLSQDHLDFHPDLEDYFTTKASLFTPERSRRGVVVVDDAWGRRLAGSAGVPVTTVATTAAAARDGADWTAADVEPAASGATTGFTLRHADGRKVRLTSPLPGGFNVANTALAFVLLSEAGLGEAEAARALAGAGGVPGRLERVSSTGADEPLALVDYAHTPDAVAAVLGALRPVTAGRLVVVLGAGGDRDPGKRTAMGEVAARGADLVVVTDDNPRSEDPAAIRAAVVRGARAAGGGEVVEVADRAQAVLAAVRATAGRADTVLVAGKGAGARRALERVRDERQEASP